MGKGSGQAAEPGKQPDPASGKSAGWRLTSDRVFGILCVTLGVWYVLETRNIATIDFVTGPVGPRTLPVVVGTLFAVLGAVLIVRPDESPSWGSAPIWRRLVAAVAASFLFGQLIEPIGFIVASTILAIAVGLLFKGPVLKLVPLSFVFAVVVAFVFNNGLELKLPPGWWAGF